MTNVTVVALAIDARAKIEKIREILGPDIVDFYMPALRGPSRAFIVTLEFTKDKNEPFGEFVRKLRYILTKVFDTDKVTLGVF